MRRFVTLAVLFLFTIPFGISISGCSKGGTKTVFCGGGDTGPIVGQVNTITLLPRIFGISLNQGQIGQVSSPQATDCNGTAVTVSAYTYGVFDATGHQSNALLQIADVVPSGVNAGKLCAGNWNRNTGGGIPDYTTCNVTGQSGEVYVVASGGGANSNPLPIFIHPKVTSVTLGNPTTACAATDSAVEAADQSSNCCQLSKQATVTAAPYDGTSCISQTQSRQLVGRAYDTNGNNITCQVGHLNFAAQTTSLVTIDENGVATAQQPGSTVISADLTQAGSSAGFFSTCAPVSIALNVPSTSGNVTSAVVNQNTPQPLTAIAKDQNGTTLTGLTLNFVSTTPITIPVASTGTITPVFPGAASITALCQPPTCNPSPQNAIGLFGNGKPVASNPVAVTTPGTNSTLLWIGSTQSRYILPVDFTNPTLGAPVRLPFAPNSMVISNDGSSIYMGTPTELMIFNATTNSLSREDPSVAGQALAVSPDGSTLIVSDPRKQLIYLYSTAAPTSTTGTTTTTATSNYGGVATHAEFTQDNQTVYITLGTPDPTDPTNPDKITPSNQLLVHSTFTGWSQITLPAPASDVAITVPSVGAYLAGSPTTGRSYCASTTVTGTGAAQVVSGNAYYPLADSITAPTDRLAATNDGLHILGATIANGGNLTDVAFKPGGLPINACPLTIDPTYFEANRNAPNTVPLGVTADQITGVIPASNSSLAFVTYTGTTGNGSLPAYTPASGAITQVSLTGATAPVAGTISSDDLTLYVGTSGDNKVHLINTQTLTDTPAQAITPNLPLYINLTDSPSTIVTPNLVVQHPRKATS
ncbi:hypothetical protein [Edaphobacter modestus]|uniref:BIG2 domain-containing protein n=1 Tax=Edaphobacter modestus TaxID=388466 RepID=A0A4Q7YUG0_9BACT|nr:hypothetical protein [Edaphobacter modestus]RZU40673.1 hypothetical protein BDD14_2143 [Edaphobacter modestus]